MLPNHPRRALVRAVIVLLFLQNPLTVFAEETVASCEGCLSKRVRMSDDQVVEKKQVTSDLNELWKEVTRDMITKNAIGREEATSAATQAMLCLKGFSYNRQV
jgi:hypothetical protein